MDRTIPAASPALSRFDVPARDLPSGVTVKADEPTCQSIQPLTFFAQPGTYGMLPKPRARRADVFRRGDVIVGSVLLFDYAAGAAANVKSFLGGLLWGEDGGPSEIHPEELVEVGDTLVILCLNPADTFGGWYKDRLRTVHHAKVEKDCPALPAVLAEAREAKAQTHEQLAPIFERHRAALMECTVGAGMLAETAMAQKDYKAAEAAYRRMLELDAAGDALPASASVLWSIYDGLALSVAMQGRAADSVPLFERASALSKDTPPATQGRARYNLACAYAEVGRFAEAATALEQAIALDEKHREEARTDSSFKAALARPEFQRLLK